MIRRYFIFISSHVSRATKIVHRIITRILFSVYIRIGKIDKCSIQYFPSLYRYWLGYDLFLNIHISDVRGITYEGLLRRWITRWWVRTPPTWPVLYITSNTIREYWRAWHKHGNNIRKPIPTQGFADRIVMEIENQDLSRRNSG